MIYTRMARLAVSANREAVVIYRTNTVWARAVDGREVRLECPVKLAPGLYRCKVDYGAGVTRISVRDIRPVNVDRELAELDRRGAGVTHARTGSPGIIGFQERANAATSAGRARRHESARIARAIRDHLGAMTSESGDATSQSTTPDALKRAHALIEKPMVGIGRDSRHGRVGTVAWATRVLINKTHLDNATIHAVLVAHLGADRAGPLKHVAWYRAQIKRRAKGVSR